MLPSLSRQRSIFVALILHYVVMGGAWAAVGALIPRMIRDLGWAYTDAGLILAAGAASFVLMTTVIGFVIPIFGIRITVAVGLGLEVVGLILFAEAPNVAIAAMIYGLLSAGGGVMEVCGNDLVVSMEKEGRGQLMNLSHSGFAFGGFVVPWLLSQFLLLGGDWRMVYRVIAAAMVIVAIFLFCRPGLAISGTVRPRDKYRIEPQGNTQRGPALLVLLLLAMGIYVGIELGLSSWLGEFSVTAIGGSIPQGARIVSVFWGGLFAGRLSAAIFYRGTNHLRMIVILSTVTISGLLILNLSNELSWIFLGAAVVGMGLSALYPLFISVAGGEYPNRRSQSMGLTSAGGGIGAMFLPLWITSIAENSGMQRAMLIYLVLSILLGSLSVIMGMMARRNIQE